MECSLSSTRISTRGLRGWPGSSTSIPKALSNLFLELASHATDHTLWVLALAALVYAAVRSIEAYGLWQQREWAQWFELLSAALYLPEELYWLLRHPRLLAYGVLVTNIVIFVFMLSLGVNRFGTRNKAD